MLRPPKRPGLSDEREPLTEVLQALRSRPSFGSGMEFEALESGGYTIFITRFRGQVFQVMKDWQAAYPGFSLEAPAQAPDPKTLAAFRVSRAGEAWDFYACGAQAYTASETGSARALLAHPHDFLPQEVRASDDYRAVAVRVHLAGGSDQWVSRSKLEKFLAGGRDGPLTGMDWGQLPE